MTTSQMPNHTHTHTYRASQRDCGWSENPQIRFWLNEKSVNTESTGGSTTHTHDFSKTSTTNATSLPPYYTLSYIIKNS